MATQIVTTTTPTRAEQVIVAPKTSDSYVYYFWYFPSVKAAEHARVRLAAATAINTLIVLLTWQPMMSAGPGAFVFIGAGVLFMVGLYLMIESDMREAQRMESDAVELNRQQARDALTPQK